MRAALCGVSPSIQINVRPDVVVDKPTGAGIWIVLSHVCGTDRKGRMGTWL